MDTTSKLHTSFKLSYNQQPLKSLSIALDQGFFLSQFSFQGKIEALLRFSSQPNLEYFLSEIHFTSEQFQIIHQYRQIPMVYSVFTSDIMKDLLVREEIRTIYGNPLLYLCLDTIAQSFHLPEIHKTLLKFNGNDITIGLIDSGIDLSHPDLSGKITRRIICNDDEEGDSTGHGTYLAGILTGSGIMSQNLYQGIIPEASLIDIKIFGKDGSSTMATLLYGLDQILTNSNDALPQILLFGCTSGPLEEHYPPLTEYCDLLIKRDVLICAPVGNFGPEPRTIGYPASLSGILAVGGLDEANRVCFFSSRGETSENAENQRIKPNQLLSNIPESLGEKPDLYLPATNIIALSAHGQLFGKQLFDNSYYTSVSGTSCAAAVAAGVCAILREAFPLLSSHEIIELIQKSGKMPLDITSYKPYRVFDLYTFLQEHGLLIRRFPSLWSQLKIAALIGGGFLLLMVFLLFWIL